MFNKLGNKNLKYEVEIMLIEIEKNLNRFEVNDLEFVKLMFNIYSEYFKMNLMSYFEFS